jgi:hypothetical protein
VANVVESLSSSPNTTKEKKKKRGRELCSQFSGLITFYFMDELKFTSAFSAEDLSCF